MGVYSGPLAFMLDLMLYSDPHLLVSDTMKISVIGERKDNLVDHGDSQDVTCCIEAKNIQILACSGQQLLCVTKDDRLVLIK